jgi:K+/H+ antiporter YhaU regulatory subunit KhtT
MTDAHEVHVRQERLPGFGQLFQMAAPDGSALTVVAEDHTGRRELHVLVPGADEPSARVELPEAHAVTLATLLSGVRVVFDSEPEVDPADGVHVETFVIGAGSPAVGQAVHEIHLPAPEDARILAVIRDDTPALVEDDADRPCEPGDRLVLAGHPSPLAQLRAFLAGR